MIGCFYEHGHWVALQLQRDPETGDTLVIARLGECPGDAEGDDVPLACQPTASTALDLALQRLAAGWRHVADEPSAPPASARAAIARPAPLDLDAAADPGGRPGTREQARAVVDYALGADGRRFCFFGNPVTR
jgi:hypothetical protein